MTAISSALDAKLLKSSLTTAASFLALCMAVSVHAQDATAPSGTATSASDTTSVIVTGIRKSMQSAQQVKKKSDNVVDSIVAEDVGKLPDNTVADALARVTGIQVSHNAGEADTVLIRGLPDIVTLINGREVYNTTGRYIALADIPASMINRVDVYKSNGADLIEGGIAGTIDVRTQRPFDHSGFFASANARAVYSDKSKKYDPNASMVVSDRWQTGAGEFGALLGLSYNQRHYHEERDFNTAPIDKSWLLPNLTGPDLVGLITIPGNRRRSSENIALQWRPDANTEYYFEGFNTRDQNDFALDYFVGLPWWAPGNTITGTKIPGTNQLQSMTSHNANTIMSTQANRIDSQTDQYTFGGKWTLSSTLRANVELTRTDSNFKWENPILDTVTVVPNVYVNTAQNGAMHLSYTGENLLDPSNYYLKGFFDRYGKDSGGSNEAFGELLYTPASDSWLKEIKGGIRLADRTARSVKSVEGDVEAPDITPNPWPYSRQNVTTIPGLNCVSEPMRVNYGLQQWYTPCASFLLDNTSVIRKAVTGTTTPKPLDPGSYFRDEEKTAAVYAQAKAEFKLGDIPVSSVFGVRVVQTDQIVHGVTTTASGYSPTSSRTKLTNVLPSAVFKFSLTPDLIARLTANSTLSRPAFAQLNPGVALVNPSQTTGGTASGGNPNLQPYTSDNFNASLEWYFAPVGMVYGTAFYSKFQKYVQYATVATLYDSHGVAQGTGCNIGNNPNCYNTTRPYNSGDGNLKGLEFGYRQFYDFLPGALSGFGTELNGTYMEGVTRPNSGSPYYTLQGVSKYNYNIILLYEKYGISGRLAYNWRSKNVTGYNNAGPGLNLTTANFGQLDGALNYRVNARITVFLESYNMLNTTYKDYWTNPAIYPRDTRSYDRTIEVGFRWTR